MQIQDIFSDKQAVKDILSSSNFDEKTITALLEAEVRVGLLVGDVAATLDISSQSFTEWIESALLTLCILPRTIRWRTGLFKL